jgi:tRNA threonylcarbamoyladenosine biosynthesis protein TsaB
LLSVNLFLQNMSQPSNSHILQINTAFNEASIGIGQQGKLIAEATNTSQQEHAAFLQPAIQDLCKSTGINLSQLAAVSVMNGPGSYTGLRVGLASAKGICYALNIPLVCINTLEWIAHGNIGEEAGLICPMIDARRMEVFTAMYDQQMKMVLPPKALVLDAESFSAELNEHRICFVGNGAAKWKEACAHPHAVFPTALQHAGHFAAISFQAYKKNQFADLAYAEPYYTKEFFNTQKNNR